MPSGRFALLLELLEVDTFLLLGLGWSRLVGSLLGTVSDGNGGIGKDVSSEEDDVGSNLSEFRGSNNQACDGSEGLDGPLRVLGQLLSGYRGGSSIDVNVDIGVRSVVLLSVSIQFCTMVDLQRSSESSHHRSSRHPTSWKQPRRS